MYSLLPILQCTIPYNVKRRWFSSQDQALADVASGNGIVDVPLAQTGEGIAECELLKWFVQEVSTWTAFALLFLTIHDKICAHIVEAWMVAQG